MATVLVQNKESMPDVYKNSHWPLEKNGNKAITKTSQKSKRLFDVLLETWKARSKHVSGARERALGSYMWPQQNVSPAVR